MVRQIECIGDVERGTEVKVAMLACQYAPTALGGYCSIILIYKQAASVL